MTKGSRRNKRKKLSGSSPEIPSKKVNIDIDHSPVENIDKMSQKGELPKDTEDVNCPKPGASLQDWGEFLFLQIKDIKTELGEVKQSTATANKVTATISKLIQENQLLKDQNNELNERLLKLEYFTRRNNLLFDGFEEANNESDKDCYSKIRTALANLYEDDEGVGEIEGASTAYEKAGRVVVNHIH